MSRTVRTNSASGSSSSSAAGLTLADVNTTLATYDIPKLLKTIDVPDGTTYIEIPNLDTTLYERFYILMRHFGCYNNSFFEFGGMSGTTKFDQDNRWSWGGMQTSGGVRNTQTTGNCYSNVGSAHTTAATTNASNSTVEWNFFFPEPTGYPTEISGNMNYMGGDYGNQSQNCYGYFMFQKSDQTTHSDGIFFKMSSGNFRKTENIFRITVYGYSRRPAPTT